MQKWLALVSHTLHWAKNNPFNTRKNEPQYLQFSPKFNHKIIAFQGFYFQKNLRKFFSFSWNMEFTGFQIFFNSTHFLLCCFLLQKAETKENPANIRKLKKIWKLLLVWHACKLYQTNSKKVSVNRPAAMNLRHKNLAWLVCTVPEVTVYVWHLLTYIWPRNQTYCMPLHMFQP